MSLTQDDVQQLLKLLDASQFDELHLETNGMKLTLRRNSAPAIDTPAASAPAPATPSPAAQAATGLLEIRAPLLGTFYVAPKPGAAPFVTVGTRVGDDTTVGIIEVMKLMNSVSAGVRGEIVEILARDGEFVEYGHVLMRVKPTA
jgi:acetyl-CoA carboxylase biotin carboxyl carrier protein